MKKDLGSYGNVLGDWYTTYRDFIKSNNLQGATQQEQIDSFMKLCEYLAKNETTNADQRASIAFCSQLFKLDVNKAMLHLFLDSKELAVFLQKLPVKDLAGIKKYIKDNGVKALFTNLHDTGAFVAYCVHIPNMAQGYVVQLAYDDTTDDIIMYVKHGPLEIHATGALFETTKDTDIKALCSFAINMTSYLISFPDCIQQGVPHKVKVNSVYNARVSTSSNVIDVIDNDARIVTPHFRSGYFRHLSSDFYKNKKGQIIFIHETFVKGTAQTVISKDKEAVK